jgi:hypothetical protein
MPESAIVFDTRHRLGLLESHANDWLELAVKNILQEYPNMPWIIATGPDSYRTHRESHPTFFGSFDWHSCVEMYWVAARLMRMFPNLPHEVQARRTIGTLLTSDNIRVEEAFFLDSNHRGFERPYGWGWLLKLWHELALWNDVDAARWHATLDPLANTLMDRFAAWLPKMTYPQRMGMHGNTAFALTLAWPALQRHRPDLLETIREQAYGWFAADVDYPANYEPSGADFLSPALCEAVLMSHVLTPSDYHGWLGRFLPLLIHGQPSALFTPVVVTDASDGQIAHLHGLNLSRAWAFLSIAGQLPSDDFRIPMLARAAEEHAASSLEQVSASDYMVEHWLAAYAMLVLSE